MTNHAGLRRLRTLALPLVTTALLASHTQVAPPRNAHSSAEPAAISGQAATNSQADSEPPDLSHLAKLTASGPHVLDGAVSKVIVHVLGSACTGTPITGTVYVITAAHCVLTPKGNVIERTVMREGAEYRPVAVLVDTNYAKHPREQVDAAVIVVAQAIPGPSARVGATLPRSGQVTLAGYQPVDSDGSLLRGTDIDDHQRATGATRSIDHLRYEPAGCVTSVRELDVSTSRVVVPCGLVPGASGGGLYAQQDGGFELVGIVSTVTADLSANGIVPIASLRELLEHPDQYAHEF
jgi:Trypsin-like peptidase domain